MGVAMLFVGIFVEVRCPRYIGGWTAMNLGNFPSASAARSPQKDGYRLGQRTNFLRTVGAIDGVEVRVIDSKGKNAPDGQTGEIAVRSPAICAG
jgi:acyl-CoA synthetase (AMP-forming)/AMP-acid ligase II